VKLHSVLLRDECILPDRLDPLRNRVCDNWTLVEEIPVMVFDTMVRQAGWHFVWLSGASSRRGFGMTHEDATSHALIRALSGVPKRYNAAELDTVQVKKSLGFYIAKVTVQPRHIQQNSSLESTYEKRPLAVSTR
jgi:hypothetical protein